MSDVDDLDCHWLVEYFDDGWKPHPCHLTLNGFDGLDWVYVSQNCRPNPSQMLQLFEQCIHPLYQHIIILSIPQLERLLNIYGRQNLYEEQNYHFGSLLKAHQRITNIKTKMERIRHQNILTGCRNYVIKDIALLVHVYADEPIETRCTFEFCFYQPP